MMNQIRIRHLTIAALAGLTAFTYGCESMMAPGEATVDGRVYQKHVETHPSQGDIREIDGAMATLVTTNHGAYVDIKTQELKPGHAYTLWWVVINDPAACANSPCKPPDVLKNTAATNSDVGYGDGIIAGDDGKGSFKSFLAKGDLPSAWFGNGLQNPTGAEFHFVVNHHGPLVPGMEGEMVGSYRGGCMDKGLPKAFPATAIADGKPGPNKCALVQDVIFEQKF